MAKKAAKPENLQRKKNQFNAMVTGKNTASTPKEMRLEHTIAGQIKDVLGNLHNVDNDDRFKDVLSNLHNKDNNNRFISKAVLPSLSDMEELLRQFREGELQNEPEHSSENLSKRTFKTCNEAIDFLVNEVGISKERLRIDDERTDGLSIDGNDSFSLLFEANEGLKFTCPIIDYIAYGDIKTPLVNHRILDTELKGEEIPVLDISRVNFEPNERAGVLISIGDRYYFKVTHGDESDRIYKVPRMINDKHLELIYGKNRATLLNGETKHTQIMVIVEDNDVQDIIYPEDWYN